MFVNFNKAFKKGKEEMYPIPDIILENLNHNLLDGFEYVQIANDMCVINPKDKNIKIKGRFKIENIEINADIKSAQELMEYLYRTQQKIEVNSNFIEINGVQFNIDEIVKMPLSHKTINDVNGRLILKPPKFPKPFKLRIGYGDKNTEMFFQRQPYPDLHKSLFKSIDKKSLVISYIVDEINRDMTVKVSINIGDVESVEEIVKIAKIYKCFMNGKGRISNIKLNKGFDNPIEKDGLDSMIEFWNEVYLISKELGIKFNPKKEVLRKDDYMIKRLYRCLVENEPYKEYISLENIKFQLSEKLDYSKFAGRNGLVLDTVDFKEYEVLGQKIELYEYIMWGNLIVTDIKLLDKTKFKYELTIDNESDKKTYRMIKYFKKLEDAEEYRNHIHKSSIELENIKTIQE